MRGMKIRARMTGRWADTAYVYLPKHPEKCTGCVAKTIDLVDLIPGYRGPRVHLDFDREENLIGIEILA